jgi:hypothetical protein
VHNVFGSLVRTIIKGDVEFFLFPGLWLFCRVAALSTARFRSVAAEKTLEDLFLACEERRGRSTKMISAYLFKRVALSPSSSDDVSMIVEEFCMNLLFRKEPVNRSWLKIL